MQWKVWWEQKLECWCVCVCACMHVHFCRWDGSKKEQINGKWYYMKPRGRWASAKYDLTRQQSQDEMSQVLTCFCPFEMLTLQQALFSEVHPFGNVCWEGNAWQGWHLKVTFCVSNTVIQHVLEITIRLLLIHRPCQPVIFLLWINNSVTQLTITSLSLLSANVVIVI